MHSKVTSLILASFGLSLVVGSFFIDGFTTATHLDINIEKADFVMPAAHRVLQFNFPMKPGT